MADTKTVYARLDLAYVGRVRARKWGTERPAHIIVARSTVDVFKVKARCGIRMSWPERVCQPMGKDGPFCARCGAVDEMNTIIETHAKHFAHRNALLDLERQQEQCEREWNRLGREIEASVMADAETLLARHAVILLTPFQVGYLEGILARYQKQMSQALVPDASLGLQQQTFDAIVAELEAAGKPLYRMDTEAGR